MPRQIVIEISDEQDALFSSFKTSAEQVINSALEGAVKAGAQSRFAQVTQNDFAKLDTLKQLQIVQEFADSVAAEKGK